jgi:hypothetical protein
MAIFLFLFSFVFFTPGRERSEWLVKTGSQVHSVSKLCGFPYLNLAVQRTKAVRALWHDDFQSTRGCAFMQLHDVFTNNTAARQQLKMPSAGRRRKSRPKPNEEIKEKRKSRNSEYARWSYAGPWSRFAERAGRATKQMQTRAYR